MAFYRHPHPRGEGAFSTEGLRTFINDFLQLRVRIRRLDAGGQARYVDSDLIDAGDRLAAHLSTATTNTRTRSAPHVGPKGKVKVDAGDEFVIVQMREKELIALPGICKEVPLGDAEVHGVALYHYRPMPKNDGHAPHTFLIVRRNPDQDLDVVNRLHEYIPRIHGEREALYSLLRMLQIGSFPIDPQTTVRLERYLDSILEKLESWRRYGFAQDALLAVLYGSDAIFSEDQRTLILARVSEIREDLAGRVQRILQMNAGGAPVFLGNATVINGDGNEVRMSNESSKYDVGGIHNPSGPVAVGDHSAAAANNFFSDHSVAELEDELRQLRERLVSEASEPEHYKAIAEVSAAEEAARRGDRRGIFESLKRAGAWVLDVASEVGATLATAALKSAMGLP
ncbi:hypothetical protein ACFY3G_20600 [Streptomyces phaeochromogenes]|uniref:hypothetical protein n=1 Tax=Streptomyces phaeochromogenes TaxID=1923 RepID=UPI00369CCA99